MRETISLHIGNSGLGIGLSCWELYLQDHEICRDGSSKSSCIDDVPNAYFYETKEGKYHPRAIFLDLDPTSVNEVKVGEFRNTIDSNNLMSGYEGTSSLFPIAYNKKDLVSKQLQERIRKLADDCTGLQGFQIHHSVSGGTGSGCTARLLEDLSSNYGKKSKWNISIFPFLKNRNGILDPYNVILSLHALTKYSDTVLLYSNDSLSQIARRVTGTYSPSYEDMNCVARQHISQTTLSQRFDSALNVDITEFQTGLVPYPRIHFISCSYSPYLSIFDKHEHTPTVLEISKDILFPSSSLCNIDKRKGKYMSIKMIFRGDVIPKQVNSAINSIKDFPVLNFVDWTPSGFKCGINYHPPIFSKGDIAGNPQVTKSVASMSSHTGVGKQLFKPFIDSFNLMFQKRAFLHWYFQEGMEEEFFNDAREDILSLIMDFHEIGLDYADEFEGKKEEEGEMM